MTYIVGLILIAVFLTYATLMFLERLSALLALPLMAASFLAVGLAADLTLPTPSPAETSDDESEAVPTVTPRLEQWRKLQHAEAELLRDRVVLLAAVMDDLDRWLQTHPDPSQALLAERLSAISARVKAFETEAEETLADFPEFFPASAFVANPRSEFSINQQTIPIGANFEHIARRLDKESTAPAGALVDQVRSTLAEVEGSLPTLRDEFPQPPPVDNTWFQIRSATDYVVTYIMYIFRAGSLLLAGPIIATVFGGMFAMYVKNLRVAERIVYWTAEFAGERPLIITLAVFFVTAAIFTSVGGLGTVIMLGTIILPILRSIGLGPVVAAGTFLIAMAMGGTLQPVLRRLWIDFYQIAPRDVDPILYTMVAIYALLGVGWVVWGTRRNLLSSFASEPTARPTQVDDSVPIRLMLAPVIPVAMVYFGRIDEITAFIVSIAYMYVCVRSRPGSLRLLARSLIDGAQLVMPPVLLMLGIGLLVFTLKSPAVQSYLRPLLEAVVPESQFGYIAIFSVAAPLALYRGPLNVWGMGLAVSAILLTSGALPPAAILGAILAAGMLQGISDPTNTANVWIAGFQGITVQQILRFTILPVWAAAIIAVWVFGFWFFGAGG